MFDKLFFLGATRTCICHFFHPSVFPCICRTPYLRNHTSSYHNFWCTCYLQVFFSYFWNFDFLGKKGKKLPKMKNNYVSHMPYLRNSKAYDHDFWCTCVKWCISRVCFHFFFEIFIFWAGSGVKGQKIAQNEK